MMHRFGEDQIVALWQRLAIRPDLVTENGEAVQVIYPGRPNDDRGGDFRNAVIATRHGVVQGDIEIHVKTSGWQAHRHDRDNAYNRVILHVVMYHDQSVHTAGGAPVLALEKYLEGGSLDSPRYKVPCQDIAAEYPAEMDLILNKAGTDRFLGKARQIRQEIYEMGAGQCLYRSIMAALGYAKNQIPFRELADRVPLAVIEAPENTGKTRQKLLGMAGFLPLHTEEAMSPRDWNLFKVRPSNSPVRRILAFTRLLERYRPQGLLVSMLELVRQAPEEKSSRDLEAGLLSGDPDGEIRLGRARAAEIIVNVLLPFAHTWGELNDDPGLASKALFIFNRYPRLAANSIERHMQTQLGLINGQTNSAAIQQGLLHLYKTSCTQGVCGTCQLSSLRPAMTSRSSRASIPARSR